MRLCPIGKRTAHIKLFKYMIYSYSTIQLASFSPFLSSQLCIIPSTPRNNRAMYTSPQILCSPFAKIPPLFLPVVVILMRKSTSPVSASGAPLLHWPFCGFITSITLDCSTLVPSIFRSSSSRRSPVVSQCAKSPVQIDLPILNHRLTVNNL